MAARLQHQLHDIAVPRGTFLIGRGMECQLSLDDALVSRRHAAIRVGDDGAATLEDLGSRNGVFLNGVRVERPEPLSDGDLIRIGSQDICYYHALDSDSSPYAGQRAMRVTMQQIPALDFTMGPQAAPYPGLAEPALVSMGPQTGMAEPGQPQGRKTAVIDAPDTAPSAEIAARVTTPATTPIPSRDAEVPSSKGSRGLPPTIAIRELRPIDPDDVEETTTIAAGPLGAGGRAGGLAIIGSVADKALALGRADEAERILQRSLTDVLVRARASGVEVEVAERAASYAMRLAAATGRGSWVDYLFQLYTALRALPPARLVDELYAAVRKVKHTDKSVLRAYTACLKEISGGFGPAERFVQQRIEGLERWAP